MKGDIKIISYLNKLLGNELVAINQYFLHARMFKNWGLMRLNDIEYHESIDEMKHADKYIERILFLEGIPNLQDLGKLGIGEDVEEMLQSDLRLELEGAQNLREAMLSEQNEAVPDGEIGEICVKGPILALGYYNSREKTAESFLQNPLNHAYDERIYKTGDLGHFAPDGNLMFHGRKDRQVKHLGHRVELGEIDLAAAKVAGVEDACALYDQAHEQIWLFYTGEGVIKRDIAVALRADLPGFMVPRKIEQLEAMPRLDNGKTDMRALAGRIADAHR